MFIISSRVQLQTSLIIIFYSHTLNRTAVSITKEIKKLDRIIRIKYGIREYVRAYVLMQPDELHGRRIIDFIACCNSVARRGAPLRFYFCARFRRFHRLRYNTTCIRGYIYIYICTYAPCRNAQLPYYIKLFTSAAILGALQFQIID